MNFKFLKQALGLVIGICALNSNGMCSTNSSSIINNDFMQCNYEEANIISKINSIETKRIVKEYTASNERSLPTDIHRIKNIDDKYYEIDNVKYKLEDLRFKHNSLYMEMEDGDKKIVSDVINKAMLYVTSQLDEKLQKITSSFLEGTLELAQDFTKQVKLLKEKVEQGIVSVEEIKDDIEKCKFEYKMIINRKIRLLMDLAADIVNYVDWDLAKYGSNIGKCLEDKICGTINQVIKIYEEQQEKHEEDEY